MLQQHSGREFSLHSTIQFSGEVMRHVSPLGDMQKRLEVFQERALRLHRAAFESGNAPVPGKDEQIRDGFRHLCHSLDRFCEGARQGKTRQHPEDLKQKLDHAFVGARNALSHFDSTAFVQRVHDTEFHRSPGELAGSGLAVVGDHLRRLVRQVAEVNPDVYELLLQGLVNQAEGLEQTRRPIA
jgi:hypothetical protein